MAITLNLKHTFTTRVVYSTEEVQEIRKALSDAATELRAVVLQLTGKQKADALVAIRTCERATAGDDEAMIVCLTKEAFRKRFSDNVRKRLEDLNVTRMGPLQTEVVTGCKGCVYIAEGCKAAPNNERCNDFATKWAE